MNKITNMTDFKLNEGVGAEGPNTFGTINTNNSDPNFDSGDKNLLNKMFQEAKLPSLPRQIFGFVQMNSSSGGIFAMRTKEDSSDIEIIRQNISCEVNDPIKTSITMEAYQDILNMYGERAIFNISTMLRSEANAKENADCIQFLKDNATDAGTVAINDDNSLIEGSFFALNRKVSELVLRANSQNIRTYRAWAVLPYSALSYFMSTYAYTFNDTNVKDYGLRIQRFGLTDFYVNPDPTDTNVYVGLKDDSVVSKSSAFFGEFRSDITSAIDPDTGDYHFYIFNRYGIAINPLHNDKNDPMLFKFTLK